MRQFLATIATCLCLPAFSAAQEMPDLEAIVTTHVVPRFETLATTTDALAQTSATTCNADAPELQAAYHTAFDAWIGVSHLRFGPTEVDDRAFGIAFWPDPRGSTVKTLAGLIRTKDPIVHDATAFATLSVAGRGFYALEFLLYDPQFADTDESYRCALTQAITQNIATNAAAILKDWQTGYAELMIHPGNDTYQTGNEAAAQLFTALLTGLEFTAQARIGRPLGSFEKPRPNRAEARRSGRSLRHVALSLAATRDLAAMISRGDVKVDQSFQTALGKVENLNDPVFASVADPQGRFRIEVLQQSIDGIRQVLSEETGPKLGISAGFNALDGD